MALVAIHSTHFLCAGFALGLSLGCSSKGITPPLEEAVDCTSPRTLAPLFVPSSAASQPAEWATRELAQSFVNPFECAWDNRADLSQGLALLNSQLNEEIPQTSFSFFIRKEGETSSEEITLDGTLVRAAAEKGVFDVFPSLYVEKAVAANSRKDHQPLGGDIPLSRDVIDYGDYSYLKITQDTPPVRWPKDATEPQKNIEIWNAKAKKWVKRTCY